MLPVYGIAFAMKRTGYSATLEKIEVCVYAFLVPPSLASEIVKSICSSLLGVALQLNDPLYCYCDKIVIGMLLCIGVCHFAGRCYNE